MAGPDPLVASPFRPRSTLFRLTFSEPLSFRDPLFALLFVSVSMLLREDFTAAAFGTLISIT